MSEVYGVFSDAHMHSWQAFSGLDEEGRNTRLMGIIGEFNRCCEEVRNAGGDLVMFSGDLFHVRSSITPDVFNPVREAIHSQANEFGMVIMGLAGNHDLKSKDSDRLNSYVAMLSGSGAGFAHNSKWMRKDEKALVPWYSDANRTFEEVEKLAEIIGEDRANCDLFLHLGLDGVLANMPATGVTADKLASFGFKRVWCGHYHNAVDFGNRVYSVGALTHQTFSDVGTKAGFWIVDGEKVKWFCSNAPKFIDIADVEAAEDLPLVVDGEYVRARVKTAKPAEVNKWRNDLLAMGAKGVLIQTTAPLAVEKREGVSVKSLAALDQSVQDYITERKMPSEVKTICADIMREIT